MEDWTILVISLSVISGVILFASCLATARYGYRRVRKGKCVTNGSETDIPASPLNSSAWLPRAQPGPNGTAQYMNGWFALDGPSRAGWSRSDSRPPSYVSTPGQENEAEGMRDEQRLS
ncbi:hypothetical protein B0A53_00439 [Rhodotorula sp. CCFEE 5036]|nr:hypothetical protein B0A53_00439 [Rhodotorula sp. CCFEE 5036]